MLAMLDITHILDSMYTTLGSENTAVDIKPYLNLYEIKKNHFNMVTLNMGWSTELLLLPNNIDEIIRQAFDNAMCNYSLHHIHTKPINKVVIGLSNLMIHYFDKTISEMVEYSNKMGTIPPEQYSYNYVLQNIHGRTIMSLIIDEYKGK